jgi:hypothetical protein
MLGEFHSPLRKGIEVWGGELGLPVESHIPISEIVSEDVDDVRFDLGGGDATQKGESTCGSLEK